MRPLLANRSARGTRLVFAKVDPEQILVYNPGYRAEHEVSLKQGTKLEIRESDMIPATQCHVPELLVPVTRDFFRFGAIAVKLGYPVECMFQWHGVKHILRVLLLTLIFCHHSDMHLSEEDKQILIYFSLLHDIGCETEGEDDTHGDKSVDMIRKKNIRIKGIQLSKKGYRIAKLLIRHHCRSDEIGMERIAVVHMLVSDEHRNAFYRFIARHLTQRGIALICTMGDGVIQRRTDTSTAFDLQERIHEQSGKILHVARTSYRAVSFETFNRELHDNGLMILEEGITDIEPDYFKMMYAVVRCV